MIGVREFRIHGPAPGRVEPDFFKAMGMRVLAGAAFPRRSAATIVPRPSRDMSSRQRAGRSSPLLPFWQ
jgi:hypothetical protein